MSDIETVLAPWLEATTGVVSAAETPDDLESVLPMIRVERIGGPDGRFTAHPRVAVDVFAGSADGARTLALTVRDALLALRGSAGNAAVVRDVRCDAGPSRQPWANERVHRRGATYTVSLRDA
ncbi:MULTISPECIES: hypothetical protein [unclassified Streptomyces]|uniref:hypothetical protein n=1 Tax=unclassified Streptomyces TaxID=2593676 RepID=UPI0033C0BC05